jgi:hypothetical protein
MMASEQTNAKTKLTPQNSHTDTSRKRNRKPAYVSKAPSHIAHAREALVPNAARGGPFRVMADIAMQPLTPVISAGSGCSEGRYITDAPTQTARNGRETIRRNGSVLHAS